LLRLQQDRELEPEPVEPEPEPVRELSEHVTSRTANAVGAALGAALVAFLAVGCGAASSGPLRPIGAGLSGPAGLEASVDSTGLRHASALAFDRHGRLWVATSGATSHSSDALYVVPRAGP